MMTRLFCSLLVLLMSVHVSANSLPTQSAIPGGVVIVPLSVDTMVKPKVMYRDRQVAVVQYERKWVAIVGVPLSAKIGAQTLSILQNGKTSKTLFYIEGKAYPTQHITIKDKRKVNPNKLDIVNIVEIRKKLGMTQIEMAKKLGISVKTLSLGETGKRPLHAKTKDIYVLLNTRV